MYEIPDAGAPYATPGLTLVIEILKIRSEKVGVMSLDHDSEESRAEA